MYRQYELTDGDTHRTCWINTDAAMKRGTQLTLKGESRIWTVEMMSAHVLEQPPLKEWRVGGLD